MNWQRRKVQNLSNLLKLIILVILWIFSAKFIKFFIVDVVMLLIIIEIVKRNWGEMPRWAASFLHINNLEREFCTIRVLALLGRIDLSTWTK